MKVLIPASRVYLRRRLPAIIAFASAVLLVLVIAALRGEYVRQIQGYWNEEEPAFAGQITAVAFTPDDPDIVYAVAAWGATSEEDVALIRGDLRTDQWEPVAQNVTDFSVSSIVVLPYQGRHRIYLSVIGRGIIRSDDDGQTWIGLSQGLASYNLVQLIAHPTDPLRLFAASVDKRGVFETHDGGDTWTDISDNDLLGISVTSMAISTVGTPQLLVGTEHGQTIGTQLGRRRNLAANCDISRHGCDLQYCRRSKRRPEHVCRYD